MSGGCSYKLGSYKKSVHKGNRSFLVATKRLLESMCRSVRWSLFGLLGVTYAVYTALLDYENKWLRTNRSTDAIID